MSIKAEVPVEDGAEASTAEVVLVSIRLLLTILKHEAEGINVMK